MFNANDTKTGHLFCEAVKFSHTPTDAHSDTGDNVNVSNYTMQNTKATPHTVELATT
jgi:hypothetical protein